MNDKGDHNMDVNVNARQSFSLPLILQALVMAGGLAGVYSNGVATDREQAQQILSLRDDQVRNQARTDRDIVRLERDTKDIKADILIELREIRAELKERARGSR